MTSKRVLAKKVLGLAVAVLAATCCGKREFNVSDAQMHELIKKDVPIGSSRSKVEAFVAGININSVEAFTFGYLDGNPIGTDKLKEEGHKVKGHLVATLPRVGRDPSKFQVYQMRIVFYFGLDERLLDYKLQTLGDW